MQAKLDAKGKSLKHAEKAAAQQLEHLQHELGAARRECQRQAGDAEDRKVQLSVLMETVETLQAGTPGGLCLQLTKCPSLQDCHEDRLKLVAHITGVGHAPRQSIQHSAACQKPQSLAAACRDERQSSDAAVAAMKCDGEI